jgi:hypothetical protein
MSVGRKSLIMQKAIERGATSSKNLETVVTGLCMIQSAT